MGVGGNELAEERVELTRGDARLPAFQGRVEGANDTVRMPPGLGGQVDARRPLDLNELALELVLDLPLALLVHQVPLVRHDDEGAARVDDLLDDAHVLLGQGSGAVDEHQRNLGLLDGGLGADGGVVVRPSRAMHLAANARRVDEPPGAPIEFDELVDGVASRAGQLVDDDALAAGQGVEQRRLADVGAPYERHAARTPRGQGRGHGGLSGEHFHDDVKEVARSAPVERRNRVGLTQPQAPQVGRIGLLEGGVNLVGGQDDRLVLRTQHLDDALVRRGHADGRVENENDGVGQVHGDLRLLGDRAVQARNVDLPPARVHQREVASSPLRGVGDAVARDARGVLDDGLAATEDAIDQRGLADVGTADDRQDRQARRDVRAVG